MENEKSPILEIKDLRVTYETDIEVVEAVNGISFQIEKGKHSVFVGETRRWQDDNSAEYSSPFAGKRQVVLKAERSALEGRRLAPC